MQLIAGTSPSRRGGYDADIVMLAIFPLDAEFDTAEQWRELDEAQAYLASFPIEPLGKGGHGQAA